MGWIASFLSRVDAVVQRQIDSVYLFLLSRFGIRKSMIRYTIQAAGILCLAVIIVMLMPMQASGVAQIFGVLAGLLLFFETLEQYLHLRLDTDDEDRGKTGFVDELGRHQSNQHKLIVIVLFILPVFIPFASDDYRLALFGMRGYAVCQLLLLYLAKAP